MHACMREETRTDGHVISGFFRDRWEPREGDRIGLEKYWGKKKTSNGR